jgi:hypothetical protein
MNDPKTIMELRQVIYDNPVVAEADDVAASQRLDAVTGYAGTTETDNTVVLAAIAARLEHPRNLVVTITAGTGLTGGAIVTAYGMGMQGVPVKEVFTYATSAAAITGNIPFVTVNRISVYGCTGTLGAADVITVGVGAKMGLPMGQDCKLVDVVKERFDGAEIAVTGTVDRTYGTYTPASTLDGSKDLELWYTTKQYLS